MINQKLSQSSPHLRILPLGGCGEFGMNLTCYIHQGKLYVVDCGVMFPEPFRLGVEGYIPDVSFIFDQFPAVSAYFITHGHEDHIGALPFLHARWPAPVYATPYTTELIKNKLNRLGRDAASIPIQVVRTGDTVRGHDVTVEYVAVNHSLPDAASLVIEGPDFRVFHTGDFKVDPDPLYDAPMAEQSIRAIGDRGIDVMLVDSTNAHKTGRCPSEKTVLEPLKEVMSGASGMVFLTTFSSNLWRLITVIEAARQLGRKIFIGGAGIETTLTLAKKTELYYPPDGVIVTADELSFLDRKKVVALVSGCQAEYRSATARLASNDHRDLRVEPGDRFVFSSRPIPGNERALFGAIDKLRYLGAEIITTRENPDIHVSGHAYQEDVQVLTEWVRPKHFVPVHGSFTHLSSHLEFAENSLGATQPHFIENGSLLELRPDELANLEQYNVSLLYIDSETHIPLDFATLRTRHRVGELGGVWVSGIFSSDTGQWLREPDIELCGVGLPVHLQPEAFLEMARKAARNAATKESKRGQVEETTLREEVRIAVRRCLGSLLGKKPVVVSLVHVI